MSITFICVVKKLQLQSPKKFRIANGPVIPDCRLARRDKIVHYIFKLRSKLLIDLKPIFKLLGGAKLTGKSPFSNCAANYIKIAKVYRSGPCKKKVCSRENLSRYQIPELVLVIRGTEADLLKKIDCKTQDGFEAVQVEKHCCVRS